MAKRQQIFVVLILAMLALGSVHARADAALFMEEPYGEFGAMNPTGHAAIYLNHVCADFSRVLLNIYYPHAIRRNFFVDIGLTTPKQVARSLTKYAKKHPEVEFSTFMIPQVPGSIKRSHPIDGVLEAVVKSKKYVVPLAVLNPELTAGMVVAYLSDGRFHAPKDSPAVMVPGEAEPEPALERTTELQRRTDSPQSDGGSPAVPVPPVPKIQE
jgi:hypothetical protein